MAQAVLTGMVGLAAIWLAGAPKAALIIQPVALAVGAVAAAWLRFRPLRPGRIATLAILAACLAVLALTLGGAGTDGVRRWLSFGPVTIQPASIALPFVILAWTAASPSLWSSVLAAALALVLALQPDAASATGLALGLIAAALDRRRLGAGEAAAIAVSVVAAGWSWTRADPLPAVAYVERVVDASFAANPAAGIAAAVLLCLLPAPFVWTWLRAGADQGRATSAGLAGLWIGLVAANLVGNYPAPMLGYGASLVLGWMASLGFVIARRREAFSGSA